MTEIEKLFNGRCPYTDKPCEDFDCHKCEVEQEERKYLEEGYYDRIAN